MAKIKFKKAKIGEEKGKSGRRKESKASSKTSKSNMQRGASLRQSIAKRIDKSTTIILISFLVIIIGFGIAIALIKGSVSRAEYYNGFKITMGEDNLWHLQAVSGSVEFDIPLHYHPSELDEIPVYGDPTLFFRLLDKYGLNAAYVSFNPAQPGGFSYVALAASEVSLSLGQVFGITPIAACAAKMEGICMERPTASCSSNDRMVIFIEESPVNRTEVVEETNCISIRGSEWDLVKAAEKMLYIWYGVIVE